MTISLGYKEPDRIEVTLATLLSEIMEEAEPSISEAIIHHAEGVDLIPANIELSALEINLVNAMSSRLWKTKNLLIRPHVAGNFTLDHTLDRDVDLFLEDFVNYSEGRPLNNLVDRTREY